MESLFLFVCKYQQKFIFNKINNNNHFQNDNLRTKERERTKLFTNKFGIKNNQLVA